MNPGDRVRHKEFGVIGTVKTVNPVTAFVLWDRGVGTEANRSNLTVLPHDRNEP